MAELEAEVIISGSHYEDYLVRLERVESLARPGSEVTFTFSPDFPHTLIEPWDPLVVYEQGVKTLTGFVQNIIPQRGPAAITVKGQDAYVRALTWFMPENLFTSGSQNIGYWVNYFCRECGLSYSINDTSGSEIVLNPDIQFGMRLIADALVNLCAVAQWQMQVDPDGVLQFNHIEHPSEPEFDITQVESYEYDVNDLDTRNRVVVWGFQDIRGGSILFSESRHVDGIPDDTRNMVFAEPNIRSTEQAESLGQAALDQWAKLARVLAVEVIGNPNVRVGDALAIWAGRFTSGSYLDTVTDMNSILDKSGYNQNITTGRRAYRYPYWPVGSIPSTEVVILLDNSLKVIYTENWTSGSTSPTWIDHSNGLTGTPMQVFFDRRDGFRCFCMTTDGLFVVDDLFGIDDWVLIYTPAAVKAAIGTANPCEMGPMGLDPHSSGRILFTGGIIGGDKYVFYSTDAGFTITLGPTLDNFLGESDQQRAGSISFGPSSTAGLITLSNENVGGAVFIDRYARKFTANGSALGDNTIYSASEFYNVEGPGFHQRSAYSNTVLFWPGNLDTDVGRSTNGGTSIAQINTGFLPRLTGQAVSFQRNASFALAVDTSGSMHRSTNGGQSWNHTNLAHPSMGVVCIMNTIDLPNNWAVAGSSVKATTNFGVSWITKVGNLLTIIGGPNSDIIWMDVYNTGVVV